MDVKKTEERTALRQEFWPQEKAWTGDGTKGWFRAPRTLPLVLALLRTKELSGHQDPSTVYLGLWARHFDSGVVEITNEAEAAYEAGYSGRRALRTWRERMRLLEKLGFIRTRRVGNEEFRYVLLVDPAAALDGLTAGSSQLPQEWLDSYRARQLATGEAVPDRYASGKVVPIRR